MESYSTELTPLTDSLVSHHTSALPSPAPPPLPPAASLEIHTADLSDAHTASLEWVRQPRPPSRQGQSSTLTSATTSRNATVGTGTLTGQRTTHTHATTSRSHPYAHRLGPGMGKTSSPPPKVVLKRNRSKSRSGSAGVGMSLGVGSGKGGRAMAGAGDSEIGSDVDTEMGGDEPEDGDGVFESDEQMDIEDGKQTWVDPPSFKRFLESTPVHLQPKQKQQKVTRKRAETAIDDEETYDDDDGPPAVARQAAPSPPSHFGPGGTPPSEMKKWRTANGAGKGNSPVPGGEADAPRSKSTFVRDMLVTLNDAGDEASDEDSLLRQTQDDSGDELSLTPPAPHKSRRLPPLVVTQPGETPHTPDPIDRSDTPNSQPPSGQPVRKLFLPRASSPSYRSTAIKRNKLVARKATEAVARGGKQTLGISLASHVATAGASHTHDDSSDPLGWVEGSTAARTGQRVDRSGDIIPDSQASYDESTDPLMLRPSTLGSSTARTRKISSVVGAQVKGAAKRKSPSRRLTPDVYDGDESDVEMGRAPTIAHTDKFAFDFDVQEQEMSPEPSEAQLSARQATPTESAKTASTPPDSRSRHHSPGHTSSSTPSAPSRDRTPTQAQQAAALAAFRSPTPPIWRTDYPSVAIPPRRGPSTAQKRGRSKQRKRAPSANRQTSEDELSGMEVSGEERATLRGGKRGRHLRARSETTDDESQPPNPARAARIAFFADLDAHYALDVELVVLGGLERGYNLLREVRV